MQQEQIWCGDLKDLKSMKSAQQTSQLQWSLKAEAELKAPLKLLKSCWNKQSILLCLFTFVIRHKAQESLSNFFSFQRLDIL